MHQMALTRLCPVLCPNGYVPSARREQESRFSVKEDVESFINIITLYH